MSTFGQEALTVALAEMGLGEEGRNNQGPTVKKYCGHEGAYWCAGFVSWCLEQAAARLHVPAVRYSTGARRLGTYLAAYLGAQRITIERHLTSGDIAIYARGTNPANGHVGIVWHRNDRGYVNVEGNVGDFPAIVGPEWHLFGGSKFLYGVRLP